MHQKTETTGKVAAAGHDTEHYVQMRIHFTISLIGHWKSSHRQ